MTEEEKEAIEYFKNLLAFYYHNAQICTHDKMNILLKLIEKQQEKVDKQSKMIDMMVEYIEDMDIIEYICVNVKNQLCDDKSSKCKECIKKYFEKKASQKND